MFQPKFDIYEKMETPDVYLCNIDNSIIGALRVTDLQMDIVYNDISDTNSISFKVYQQYQDSSGKVITQHFYDSIEAMRKILVKDIGYFLIDEPALTKNAASEYKVVSAISTELEFQDKYLEYFYINNGDLLSIDDVSLINSKNKEHSLMHLILEDIPYWSIGHIDECLINLQRHFEVEKQDVYSFLMNEFSEAFEAYIEFDTLNNLINIYHVDNYGIDTDVFVSADVLTKEMNVKHSRDDIKTYYTVTGKDDLDIRAVNLGNAGVWNLGYYHSPEWMGKELYEAYSEYLAKTEEVTEIYIEVLSKLNSVYLIKEEFINRFPKSDLNTTTWSEHGLISLQQQKLKEELVLATMKEDGMNVSSHAQHSRWVAQYNLVQAIKSNIIIRELEIEEQNELIESKLTDLTNIGAKVSMKNNFTEEQLVVLGRLKKPDDYQNEYYLVTEDEAESSILQTQLDLLAAAKKDLAERACPQYSFTMDMLNILANKTFEKLHNQFIVGNYIHVGLRKNVVTKVRILKIHIEFDNPDGFSAEFGSFTYRDIYSGSGLNPTTAKSLKLVKNNAPTWNNTVNKVDDLEGEIKDIEDIVSDVVEEVGRKSTITRGTTQPKNPVDNDLWYKETNTTTELWAYDGTEWVLLNSDASGEIVSEATEKAVALAIQAKKDTEDAIEHANQAVESANNALMQSGLADTSAQGALDLSNQSNALSNQALALAQSANAQIPIIQSNADSALASAQSALDAYNNIKIGVRNLLFHTSETFTISKVGNGYAASTGRLLTSFTRDGKGLLLENGKTYIIQYDYTIENYVSGVGFGLGSGSTIGTYDHDTFIGTCPYSNYGGNAGKVIYKFTYTGTETRYLAFRPMRINSGNDGNTMVIAIKNLIIVEGNIAPVDWAPAIEDIQIQFTTINNELLSKISQTTFNTLQGTVNSQNVLIQQNIKDIALKASSVTVDTLSSRVQSAEAGILVNANSITQKASASDVNVLTGRVSLAESSLTTQAGTITALSTLADGHTTKIGSLETGYNGLTSTVSRVESDFNNLSIGGRNYAQATGTVKILTGFKGTQNYNTSGYTVLIDSNWKVGDTLTCSCDINYTTITWSDSATKWTVQGSGNVTGWSSGSFNSKDVVRPVSDTSGTVHTEWKMTLTANHLLNGLWIIAVRTDYFTGGSFTWKNLMVEHATKASSWQPAIEDFPTSTQVTSLEQTVSTIQATLTNKADSTWVTNQLTLTADSTKSMILNQITGEYSYVHQAITGLQTTVAGKASTAQITLLENQITQTVASLQSGGSNLFNDSRGLTTWGIASAINVVQTQIDETSSPYGKATKFTMNAGASGGVYKTPAKALAVGRTYSWSVYLKTYTSGNLNVGLEQGGKKSCNVTTEWTRFTHTFVATDSAIYAFVFYRNTSSITELYIHSPVLVEGNIAPNWCESLSDIATQSQITQLNTDINLRVTKGEVINQINVSTESILIAGNKVHITGSTTIDHGVITNANIVDGAITNAKISNLSADKITAGILKSTNYKFTSGSYSTTGTSIDLTTGNITTPNFAINASSGTAYFKGSAYLDNGLYMWFTADQSGTSASYKQVMNIGILSGASHIYVNESAYFPKDVTMEGSLWARTVGVWGATSLSGTLTVSKNTTFNGDTNTFNGNILLKNNSGIHGVNTSNSNKPLVFISSSNQCLVSEASLATIIRGNSLTISAPTSMGSTLSMAGNRLHLRGTDHYIDSSAVNCVRLSAGNLAADLIYETKDGIWNIHPAITNQCSLGCPTDLFYRVYSTQGVLQTSDKNAKNSYREIDCNEAIDFVMDLKPASYLLNGDSTNTYHEGFYAQDIEKTLAKLGMKLSDFGGVQKHKKKDGTYSYTLIYDELLPRMVAMLQMHEKTIQQLKQDQRKR